MRDLVWRTVRAVGTVLVVLMILTVVIDYPWGARTPQGAADLLSSHYATNALDKHWEVRRVEAEPGGVVVHLRIPEGAAASFQRIPPGGQFQVFGSVCPRREHPVWQRITASEDIWIHSASRSGESIMRRLSCRHWNGV
jgi:hypothetical protein